MKKIFIIMVAFLSVSFVHSSKTVFASENTIVSSQIAYLCDYHTGTVIFSKNEDLKKPIASMTKIMLLNLIFENEEKGIISFNDIISVSEKASSMGGSQVFLEKGGMYKVSDLVKSIIVASANDSSVAMAELLYGSEDRAVEEMNNAAKKLNLKNTVFSNCTGLPKPTQFSTAKEVSIMFRKLLQYKKYYEFSKIYLEDFVHPDNKKVMMTNTNKLVKFYEGCDGGKTGYTSEAGFCLAATAIRGNTRVVGVIMNGKDSKTRFADCSNLFNYAFDNYTSKMIVSKDILLEEKVEVKNGKQSYVEVLPEEDYFIFGKKNINEDIEIKFVPNSEIKAPLKKGETVGKLQIYKKGVEIGQVNVVCKDEVKKRGIFDGIYAIAAS